MKKIKISLIVFSFLVSIFGLGDFAYSISFNNVNSSFFSLVNDTTKVVDSVNDTLKIDSSTLLNKEQKRMPVLKYLEQQDEETGGYVVVSSNVNIALDNRQDYNISGYRIRLFFDNSQNARSKANEVEAKFLKDFPELPVYIQYNAPYFTVSVGNYTSYLEAFVYSQHIMKYFPKAFVVKQDIPISCFKSKRVEIAVDTLQNN